MNTSELKDRFYKTGVIPVIALDDAKDAAPLGEALMKGGLPAAEVINLGLIDVNRVLVERSATNIILRRQFVVT